MEKDEPKGKPQASKAKPRVQSWELDTIIRSDALVSIRELLSNVSESHEVEQPLQLWLTVDANLVQKELRWRVRSRRNPDARSGLHESVDSGTVVLFAPTALLAEIEEHLEEIAEYGNVSLERAREEWQQFQICIHFFDPDTTQVGDKNEYPDPDDIPYKLTHVQLQTDAIYTRDHHFNAMDVPAIRIDVDSLLRDYARASSVKFAVTLGSSFTITISFELLRELARGSAKLFKKIPKVALWVALGAVGVALIHPVSRRRIINFFRSIWEKFKNPEFRERLGNVLAQFAQAYMTAAEKGEAIEAAIPKRRRPRTALALARVICVVEKSPLTIVEIERRMKKYGYRSVSRNFHHYLRRVMRKDGGFLEEAPGLWRLRANRTAA